ncbi:MAG TPA: AbrB/MazE/SpoVT family DNA-binding domain-containing protein [Solirubrobacteraceae bacterium]|jgi:AbrB family looped-hinge helix DNA binding protein|nr:AbrB/MazE/SpoVT family DNA-binding domain-containing protein [Solirubrobacteraceae bacterium]
MTYKVGPKGQVVLPKDVRERLGIEPGDEVTVEGLDSEVRIRRVTSPVTLRGLLSDPTDDVPLTRLLELDHRWEIAHDEMRQAESDMRPRVGADSRMLQNPLERKNEKAKASKSPPSRRNTR